MDKILKIIDKIDLPFAYDHFAEGESPSPPFLIYLLPSTNHMGADGKVYYKINRVNLEIYSNKKDIKLERKVEAVLDEYGIFYDKSEVWIASEKLYEVLYKFEMEEKYE
ncbi:hypothetical protein [Ligilactobacillus ceti]|uniref:hypothetical protein n=1 Tax=Ligilactobacillus ceti TaxID=395085 RepID=UPI0004805851|nr:hypothetical protein [Ligilactobacillus ceti]